MSTPSRGQKTFLPSAPSREELITARRFVARRERYLTLIKSKRKIMKTKTKKSTVNKKEGVRAADKQIIFRGSLIGLPRDQPYRCPLFDSIEYPLRAGISASSTHRLLDVVAKIPGTKEAFTDLWIISNRAPIGGDLRCLAFSLSLWPFLVGIFFSCKWYPSLINRSAVSFGALASSPDGTGIRFVLPC